MSEEVKRAVEVWFTHIGGDEPKYLSAGELGTDQNSITVLMPSGRDIVKSHVDALWGIAALTPKHSVRLAYDADRELVKWPGGRYQFKEQGSPVSWLYDDGRHHYWEIVPYEPEIEIVGISISRPDLLRHLGAPPIGMQYDEQEIRIELGGQRKDLYFLLGFGYLHQHAAAGWTTRTTYEIAIDEPFSKDCKTTLVDHLIAMGMFTDEAVSAIRELQEAEKFDACCHA